MAKLARDLMTPEPVRCTPGCRLYSRTIDPDTGRRRNLAAFKSLAAARQQERAVQFFKPRG